MASVEEATVTRILRFCDDHSNATKVSVLDNIIFQDSDILLIQLSEDIIVVYDILCSW